MSQQTHLTVGEIARLFDAPSWKVRNIVDSLDVEIPRAGLYRMIPRSLLTTIACRLENPISADKSREF